MEVGEFNSPAGLCVDGRNRLYIADKNNSRVQVFQLSRASESETASTEGIRSQIQPWENSPKDKRHSPAGSTAEVGASKPNLAQESRS